MAGILLCRVCISDYVRWLCLLFKTTTTTKLRCITVESFQSEWMNIWMRWKRTWCICIFYRFFEVTYEVDSRILSFEFIFDRKIERFKPQQIDLKNTLCEEEIHFFKICLNWAASLLFSCWNSRRKEMRSWSLVLSV